MLGLDASPTLEPIPDTTASNPLSDLPLSQVPKPLPLREFATAFVTIFLAEIGDKTQLATLMITAESQSPWVVFAGAAAALLTTSLLGVLIGRWLARHVSDQVLQTATGSGMLFIAVLLLWDIVHIG